MCNVWRHFWLSWLGGTSTGLQWVDMQIILQCLEYSPTIKSYQNVNGHHYWETLVERNWDLESISIFSSVHISRSVVSDSFRPHELQHASTAKIQSHDLNPGPLRWLDSITDTTDMNLSKLWEIEGQRNLACCSPWDHRVRHHWATEQPAPPPDFESQTLSTFATCSTIPSIVLWQAKLNGRFMDVFIHNEKGTSLVSLSFSIFIYLAVPGLSCGMRDLLLRHLYS